MLLRFEVLVAALLGSSFAQPSTKGTSCCASQLEESIIPGHQILTGYQDGYNFSPNQVYAAAGDIRIQTLQVFCGISVEKLSGQLC